jgi:tetratricopeptide (TPR) repeat protein
MGSAIFSFLVIGLISSALIYYFFFKDSKERKIINSVSSGFFMASVIILVFKTINVNINGSEPWYEKIAISLIRLSSESISHSVLYISALLCVSLIVFFNLLFKKKNVPIPISVSPSFDSDSSDRKPIKIKIKGSEYRSYDSDLLPYVDVWVGREPELILLDAVGQGVVVISGFGGQGKSALASKQVKNISEKNKKSFWDWRDCKEESDRFRTQLISVISNYTQGECLGDSFSDVSIADISKTFFKIIQDKKGVVVFDNVDHYVDTNENLFTSDVSSFVNEALRVEHNFLIIFTCRPRVNYPSSRFREVYLRGFDIKETKSLFDQKIPGGLKDNLVEKVEKFHKFSEGHPLWLNIIASQIARNPSSVDEIINEMEAGQMDERAKSMLRSIWKSLNDKQQSILRCMAEVGKAVEEDKIYDFAKDEIPSENQFGRAFRGLISINIVVGRTDLKSTAKKYDLHPMVRTFIRQEYHNKTERKHYISLVLKAYDNFILVFRQSCETMTAAMLGEVVTKIELELENGDYVKAIETIDDTADDFVERGYHEEYVRLSKKVFDSTDWNNSEWLDNKKFESLVLFFIKSMIEIGQVDEGLEYLENYTNNTNAGTARYIAVCELNCYVHWFLKDFPKAIEWGERGVGIKEKSGIDTSYDCSHSLALSLRDSGKIDGALKIFTLGVSIKDILNDDHKTTNRGATFYGNIGRCLEFNKELGSALKLYVKSYDLLERDSGATILINKGYASYWIAGVLCSMNKYYESYLFAKRAFLIWETRSPIMARGPEELMEKLKDKLTVKQIETSDTQVEMKCKNFVTSKFSS